MNKQLKGYSIILYLIWPFSALFVGIRNFDSRFGRNILIALYAFLGFTAVSIGDLERYEAQFYDFKTATFSQIISEFASLQSGKFYIDFVSLVAGLVFDSHHYYFLICFLLYGYFYINTINLLKNVSLKSLNKFGKLFFFALLLFLFVRPIPNLAYYSGGVYILFLMVSYSKFKDTKYLWLMVLAPLFHIGLSIYLILPVFLLLFKNKTWYYVLFVVVTFAVGKSNVVGVMENVAESNSESIINSKYAAYASEDGQDSMEERYAGAAAASNIKLKSLMFLQDSILFFFTPLGTALIFLKRKSLLIQNDLKRLFHIVLLFLGISNLMLNISQGERFLLLFSFMAIALFFVVYLQTATVVKKTIFTKFLYVFVPLLFIFGLMALYSTNPLFSIQLVISNFFIEIYNYSF